MPKKKKYEESLNEALDADISWSRLNKEDLVELTMLFSEPKVLLERLGYETESDKPVDKLMDLGKTWYEKAPGPVASSLRGLLESEKTEE